MLPSAKSYLRSFFSYAGLKAWGSLSIMVFLGMTEGIGLLLLIPLLGSIGFYEGNDSNRLTRMIGILFEQSGVPRNLFTILCMYVGILSLHALVRRSQELLNAQLVYGCTRLLRDRLFHLFIRIQLI